MPSTSYGQTRRLAQAKAHEFDIVSNFKYGFRNREDITNLPPGVLIKGSQNVLTNVSERVQIRQGYSLDGATSSVAGPVLSSFDWLSKQGEVHMRAGGLTSAGNDGKLQWRYDDGAGNIVWEDLLTSLTTVNYNFAKYWNTSESIREVLFVNGTSNIFRWNGAHAIIASTTSSTITKTGTQTFLEAGFYQNANKSVRINGTTYTYTGIGNAQTNAYSQSPTNATFTPTQANWIAQLFTTGAAATHVSQVVITIHSSTTQTPSAVFAARIYTDNAGVPGTEIGSAQATIPGAFSSGDFILTFNFGSAPVSALTNYHFVLFSETVNTSTLTIHYGATGSVGTNHSTDTGGTWLAQNGYLNAVVTTIDTTAAALQLIGVSPDPTGEANGSVIAQSVVTTANSAMTTIPQNFANGLIESLNNQVYVGSLTSSALYISKINDYTDYSLSSPRQTGDGALLILDDNLTTLIPQEQYMYVTAGHDLWYNVSFQIQTSTVGVTYEQVNALLLKNGKRQAPQSQAFVSHMKNNVIVVTLEPTIDTFGRVETSLATPQTVNISDPIKLDVDSYDFTDGSIAYWRYFILVAVPKEGIVRLFNLNTKNWEAPQTLPISHFYIVDGELYGHSYNTLESYKLFDGYADRTFTGFAGYPIQANWVFSYQNYGTRFALKKATKAYFEGYINPVTTLTAKINYDLDGCKTTKTFTLDGNDGQFVCLSAAEGSLGKESLGKVKFGGDITDTVNNLPPKFRWFPTFANTDFFEANFELSVLGVNERCELLAFGMAASGSSEIPTDKMD